MLSFGSYSPLELGTGLVSLDVGVGMLAAT